MTRTLGAGRWRQMPGRQTVYYRRRTPIGFNQFALTDCWRRPLVTLGEADTSQGIYRQALTNWFIPKDIYGETPAPGDQIQTDAGDPATRHTVAPRGVSEALALTVWQVATVNLSIAHALRDRVSVYAATNAQDAAGGRVPVFTLTAADIPARVQLQDVTAADRMGKKLAVVRSYRIFLSEQVLVKAADQLRDQDGTVYTVTAWHSPDTLDSLFVVDAEVSPP